VVLKASVAPAPWCPAKRAFVATVAGPAGAALGSRHQGSFTAYVDDDFVPAKHIRVDKRSVRVCIGPTGVPAVLLYGPDSRGLPIEYSSVRSAQQ
jgi:hypothetical protein